MGIVKDARTFTGNDKLDMLIENCVQELKNEEKEAPKSPKRQSKKYDMPKWKIDRNSPHKSKNSRHVRRCENLKYLLDLADDDGLEWDLFQLTEPNVSVFAELFMEQEKMKMWNDFINHTEEEQLHFLQCEEYSDDMPHCHEDDTPKQPAKNSTTAKTQDNPSDERKAHPAFSAEECFERIDTRLKALLRKKHMPKGALEHLEEEITSFFKEWPNAVYLSQLGSSFDRLLVHALCQYLDLRSRSFDDDSGVRQTQVENKSEAFSPPDISLTKFLEEKH